MMTVLPLNDVRTTFCRRRDNNGVLYLTEQERGVTLMQFWTSMVHRRHVRPQIMVYSMETKMMDGREGSGVQLRERLKELELGVRKMVGNWKDLGAVCHDMATW